MGKRIPWYKNDDFWKNLKPFLFTEEKWENAKKEINNIISLLDIKGYGKILDLCCGTGRHSLELASRGFYVTGVDTNSTYLREAKRKAKIMGVKIDFVKEDMRKFCNPDNFDAVINMFTSFGYFERLEDDRKVLLNIYQSLKKGGKLLIDLMGKEVLARKFRSRDWSENEGIFLLEHREIREDWNKIYNEWIIIMKRVRKEYKINLRLYSGNEISELLYNSGFSTVKIFGDLEGSPYDHEAKRLVAVAYK